MLRNTTVEVEGISTRKRIFAVAAHLFAEKGYNGVSVREISEQSGVSKPTVYYYFDSKEGIYKALVDEGLGLLERHLEEVRALDAPVRERLAEFFKERFRESSQHPEFAKFVLSLFLFPVELPFLEGFKLQVTSLRRMLAGMIQEGIDSGEFGAAADPQLASDVVGGVLAHFIAKQLNSDESILSDELAEEVVGLLFRGLNE